MGYILAQAGEGVFLTISELHKRTLAPLGVSMDACRNSLKLLEQKHMLVKEKIGRNIILKPTLLGYDWFRPRM